MLQHQLVGAADRARADGGDGEDYVREPGPPPASLPLLPSLPRPERAGPRPQFYEATLPLTWRHWHEGARVSSGGCPASPHFLLQEFRERVV